MPYGRLTDIFDKIFHVNLCKRTVENAQIRMHEAILSFEREVCTQLLDARTLHVDETGMRVDGKLFRMHVTSTPYLTAYQAHSG